MKPETLAIARPPKGARRQSKQRKRFRPGMFIRVMLAVAFVVAASWLLIPGVRETPSGDVPLPASLVATEDVNLRSGPGTSFEVITVVPGGAEVAASTQVDAGFVEASFRGTRGWIAADYLTSPQKVEAGSHTVQAFSPGPGPAESQPDTLPVPTEPVEPVAPEPTVMPVYEPVAAQSMPMSAAPQPGEKWIEVNRTTRTVTLHNGEIVVAHFPALIGKNLSPDGYYSTATGTYYVHVKEKALVETPFAEGVYLTDFVGFDPHRSNGFHSPVRDEFGNVIHTGGTSTLGCVRLAEEDAVFLFNFAAIGMRVEVHD